MEIIHRRTLPHWYVPGAAHFITYRLYGSLPVAVIRELKKRKEHLLAKPSAMPPVDYHTYVNKLMFAAYDQSLDQAPGEHWLRDSRVASMVRGNLYHHDGSKYYLHAFCIMPNHVHVLLTPNPDEVSNSTSDDDTDLGERPDARSPLSKIMHSLKSYTANQANKFLRRSGAFWQAESYDHWVRDDNEMERILNYIRANPVKAGLVSKHEDWFWSSCHDRYLLDGDSSGWLPTS
jgi:putative transposase